MANLPGHNKKVAAKRLDVLGKINLPRENLPGRGLLGEF